MSKPADQAALDRHFRDHSRHWRSFDYVYPVISRRSRGLSIGVNLNPDMACNFDCIYCCVDRTQPPRRRDVDLEQLSGELDQLLAAAAGGHIWLDPAFADVPATYRRINDIAFSGDGEPTIYPRFAEACERVAALKAKHSLAETKIVLITNATLLDRPTVQAGLAVLDANNGEVWAKLDAGSAAYYKQVDRSSVPLEKVLANIAACGRQRRIVIQSLFMRIDGRPPSDAEFAAYLDRLEWLLEQGCRINAVQLYTIARQTAIAEVTALADAELDRFAERAGKRPALNNVQFLTYHGA